MGIASPMRRMLRQGLAALLLVAFASTCSATWYAAEDEPVEASEQPREGSIAEVGSEGKPKTVGVVIITLESRREAVDQFLSETGMCDTFKCMIFNALTKDTIRIHDLKNIGLMEMNSTLNEGEVACALSHRRAMSDFLNDQSITHAVIFEDDAAIESETFSNIIEKREKKDVASLLQEFIATSDSLGWDALNLGRCYDQCHTDTTLVELDAGVRVVKSYRALCAQSYIVTKKGARTMLDYEKTLGLPEDEWRWRAASQQGALNYYSITPRLFTQNRQKDGLHKVAQRMPECWDLEKERREHEKELKQLEAADA